ncbi:MAG: phosphatase PAP2 family protein, partial [Muribaculaceae bacterium]|nr:phosphatase PAP2 family protein [Muribaculaceae bacterium]
MKTLTRREYISLIASLAVWFSVTAIFVGVRPEHILLCVLIAALFLASGTTRRLIVALMPFVVFGISYDWMNMLPNYMVNPVDTEGIYNAEKSIFGISSACGTILTPNEFFARHTSAVSDFLGGIFYLCWVPVPIIFGLWLYYKNQRTTYLHFALVFLLVNLIGFAGYYIHPAAPPWYIAEHGFDVIIGCKGSVAGLKGFGEITGWNVFDGLYARNANVYAAVPSLHSAYTLVAFIYSLKARCPQWIRVALAIITVGIWFTAVYTSHHYIID